MIHSKTSCMLLCKVDFLCINMAQYRNFKRTYSESLQCHNKEKNLHVWRWKEDTADKHDFRIRRSSFCFVKNAWCIQNTQGESEVCRHIFAWGAAVPVTLKRTWVSGLPTLKHEGICVGGLFNMVLSLSFFCHCSFQLRHPMVETSYIFTTTTSGHWTIFTVYSSLDASKFWALIFRKVMFVTV
jgi:hypothetical protein